MNKKSLWFICWIISVLYVLTIISIPLLYVYFANDFESKMQLGEFIREYTSHILFRFGGLISFVFWIYTIVIWNKRKDNIFYLLLLLFLNAIYSPIYYLRIIKKEN
jgi:hypothetical protein